MWESDREWGRMEEQGVEKFLEFVFLWDGRGEWAQWKMYIRTNYGLELSKQFVEAGVVACCVVSASISRLNRLETTNIGKFFGNYAEFSLVFVKILAPFMALETRFDR